jgi:hypothetical protein
MSKSVTVHETTTLYDGNKQFAEFGVVAGPRNQTVTVYMKEEGSSSADEMIVFSVHAGRLIYKLNSIQEKGNKVDAE